MTMEGAPKNHEAEELNINEVLQTIRRDIGEFPNEDFRSPTVAEVEAAIEERYGEQPEAFKTAIKEAFLQQEHEAAAEADRLAGEL